MLSVTFALAATAFPYKQLYETLRNIPDMTWTPEIPENALSLEDIKARLSHTPKRVSLAEKVTLTGGAPESIDWPTKNPACANVIRDQGQCGSCWAFAAIAAFSDGRCIQKVDAKRVQYSEQQVVSCDKTDFGCNGGFLDTVWVFLQNTGTVTDKCYPYTSGKTGQTGTCKLLCQDGSHEAHVKNVKYADVCTTEESIKTAVAKGPIVTGFTVYSDFQLYKSGIYQHKTGGQLGGHAVAIVGYGEENGIPYWNVKNSWGAAWGEKGYFRILRGKDECGFEDQCIYPTVK